MPNNKHHHKNFAIVLQSMRDHQKEKLKREKNEAVNKNYIITVIT